MQRTEVSGPSTPYPQFFESYNSNSQQNVILESSSRGCNIISPTFRPSWFQFWQNTHPNFSKSLEA